jgi:hypothetical protein
MPTVISSGSAMLAPAAGNFSERTGAAEHQSG